MPVPNDYRDIIKALSAKTEEGNVAWRKDKYTVSVTVDNTRFSLWAGNDENSDVPFVAFGMYGPEGTMVDSWYVDESDADYAETFQLYKSANRHAQGVPARLKELAGKISQMKIIGAQSD
jgi:hypothetical protein